MQKARTESVELFRVLPNRTLDELAEKEPSTVAEMLSISGIAEKKFQKYGHELLALIAAAGIATESEIEEYPVSQEKPQDALSVGQFLDTVNDVLYSQSARVQGEVSSVDVRGNYLFYSLKDAVDGSMINCFMWARDYALSGVKLEEGLEVIIQGLPEIYKPTGRFTVRVSSVELVGEGALKKAYDKLKATLEREGVFAEENKRELPEYPHTIGVITSRTGAVIHDFLNNLGKYGYHIKFFNSRVEGQQAVRDIASGLKHLQKADIDVLVMIRGGGSLESLQAYNNETIVREVSRYPVPVIAGIGHDKDVPLVSLAADRMVSTPTAVTVALNESWARALQSVELYERSIMSAYKEMLATTGHTLGGYSFSLEHSMRRILSAFSEFKTILEMRLSDMVRQVGRIHADMSDSYQRMVAGIERSLRSQKQTVTQAAQVIESANPERLLRLGYSIARSKEGVVRSIDDVTKNEELEVLLADGKIGSTITKITKHKHGKTKS
jgi:exodeoxyribonuclease VII large subunit